MAMTIRTIEQRINQIQTARLRCSGDEVERYHTLGEELTLLLTLLEEKLDGVVCLGLEPVA